MEINHKECKELIPKLKRRRLGAITLQGATEKVKYYFCNIKCNSSQIILHFGCTNIIFLDYNTQEYKLLITNIVQTLGQLFSNHMWDLTVPLIHGCPN